MSKRSLKRREIIKNIFTLKAKRKTNVLHSFMTFLLYTKNEANVLLTVVWYCMVVRWSYTTEINKAAILIR